MTLVISLVILRQSSVLREVNNVFIRLRLIKIYRLERTAFVLTDEMAFAMGGKGSKGFNLFSQYCFEALNLIRREGNHIINLFVLMLSAGITIANAFELNFDEIRNARAF